MKMVPVIAEDGTPLAACHPARARELVKCGRAVRRHAESGFYIQLCQKALKAASSEGAQHA